MAHDIPHTTADGHRHRHAHGRGHDHGHDHGHGHDHAHHDGAHHHDISVASGRRVGLAALVTGVFLVVETAGGILSGSLALLADAGHMLSDFASLLLAWLAFHLARRPPDASRTYGFARFSVLAAFVNGIALIALSVWIMVEGVMRLLSPQPVDAQPMLWVALAGLGANIVSFLLLHGADRDNMNVRGALLHVLGDLLGSGAAILASLIILFTGWTPADPILSALISLIMLRSAWGLVRESGHVLLEGAPGHVDIGAVSRDLVEHVEGVLDVHHAHVWSLDGRQPMITLHARVADLARAPAVVAAIKSRLAQAHGIGHATVETEAETCAGADCA